MEPSPSYENNNHPPTLGFPDILWAPKFNYCVHKSPALVPILSQINPVRSTSPISLISILIVPSHLRLELPSGLFPSGFPTKTLYPFPFSPKRAICPVHLILLDVIILIIWRVAANILNKQSRIADKGWSCSLWVGRGAKELFTVEDSLLRNVTRG
jgi:hypothetical protein